jgi:methionyl aminopeptidase
VLGSARARLALGQNRVMVSLKSETELATMRAAGRIVAAVLAAVGGAARPGVRLTELDDMAADLLASRGATPSFPGYHPSWAPTPFPAVLCLSVNDEIVHGIPDGRVLREGDLLSVDCAAHVDGLHADAARTVAVGETDAAGQRLMDVTSEALAAGITAARAGGRLGDVSHAIEAVGRAGGYGIAPWFGGHGIGAAMHEDPPIPNTGRAGRGLPLRAGLTLAIEPMFLEGGVDDSRTLADGWTMATTDGSRAAHFEHTIAVTENGPVVLSAP